MPEKGFLEVLALNGIKLTPTVARQLIKQSQAYVSNPQAGVLINYKNALRLIHIDADATCKGKEDSFEDLTWIVREDQSRVPHMTRSMGTFYHYSTDKGQNVKKMTLNAIDEMEANARKTVQEHESRLEKGELNIEAVVPAKDDEEEQEDSKDFASKTLTEANLEALP